MLTPRRATGDRIPCRLGPFDTGSGRHRYIPCRICSAMRFARTMPFGFPTQNMNSNRRDPVEFTSGLDCFNRNSLWLSLPRNRWPVPLVRLGRQGTQRESAFLSREDRHLHVPGAPHAAGAATQFAGGEATPGDPRFDERPVTLGKDAGDRQRRNPLEVGSPHPGIAVPIVVPDRPSRDLRVYHREIPRTDERRKRGGSRYDASREPQLPPKSAESPLVGPLDVGHAQPRQVIRANVPREQIPGCLRRFPRPVE